eukprot:jgi/Tetstr1/439011/TSEL_027503.t1
MSKFSAEPYRVSRPASVRPASSRRVSDADGVGAYLNPREYLGKQAPAAAASTEKKPLSARSGRTGSMPGVVLSSKSAAGKSHPASNPLSAIVDRLATKLADAEAQLARKDAKLKEQAAELQSAQEAANEMRHAKVRALDALRDMEAQNTKLVRAYLDKKREAQQIHSPQTSKVEQDALVERLQEEIEDLKYANSNLQRKLEMAYQESASASASEDGTPVKGVPRSEQLRRMKGNTMTPKTLKIRMLEDDAKRLSEQNTSLRQEQEAILRRTVQRDKADHYAHMGNIALQHNNYEEAIQHYSAAIAMEDIEDFYNAELHAKRAACYVHVSKYIEAIYDTTLSISLDNSNPKTYQRRAGAYAAIGAFSAALGDLAEVKQLGVLTEEVQQSEERLAAQASGRPPVNHYRVLGLSRSASDADVRSAYKRHALKFHPDKAACPLRRGAAEVAFRLVSDASRTLSDPVSRAQLDSRVS